MFVEKELAICSGFRSPILAQKTATDQKRLTGSTSGSQGKVIPSRDVFNELFGQNSFIK